MPTLNTTYLGLALRNPIIIGSSSQTVNAEKARALEEAGAGALVLKSIFEEQIRADVSEMYDALEADMNPAALDYLQADLPMQLGPERYLDRLREIRAAVKIPVIASVNCVHADQWVSFARKIEVAGADAIELNVYDIPDSPNFDAESLEARHAALVEAVRNEVGLPVSVKIGPYYSSLMHFAKRLEKAGAAGLVIFNRFFQPDIDVEELTIRNAVDLSRPEDIRLPLRWTAMLRNQLASDLALTGGVHDAVGAIKAILAGADAVQICSILYLRKDLDVISEITDRMLFWMEGKGFEGIDDFRGALAEKSLSDQAGFERAQYVKTLVGME